MKIRLVLVAVGQPEFFTLAVMNPINLVCFILHEHFARVVCLIVYEHFATVLTAKLLIMRCIKPKFKKSTLYLNHRNFT